MPYAFDLAKATQCHLHAYLSGVAGLAACALLMSMRRPEVDCGGGLAAYNSMPRGYS